MSVTTNLCHVTANSIFPTHTNARALIQPTALSSNDIKIVQAACAALQNALPISQKATNTKINSSLPKFVRIVLDKFVSIGLFLMKLRTRASTNPYLESASSRQQSHLASQMLEQVADRTTQPTTQDIIDAQLSIVLDKSDPTIYILPHDLNNRVAHILSQLFITTLCSKDQKLSMLNTLLTRNKSLSDDLLISACALCRQNIPQDNTETHSDLSPARSTHNSQQAIDCILQISNRHPLSDKVLGAVLDSLGHILHSRVMSQANITLAIHAFATVLKKISNRKAFFSQICFGCSQIIPSSFATIEQRIDICKSVMDTLKTIEPTSYISSNTYTQAFSGLIGIYYYLSNKPHEQLLIAQALLTIVPHIPNEDIKKESHILPTLLSLSMHNDPNTTSQVRILTHKLAQNGSFLSELFTRERLLAMRQQGALQVLLIHIHDFISSIPQSAEPQPAAETVQVIYNNLHAISTLCNDIISLYEELSPNTTDESAVGLSVACLTTIAARQPHVPNITKTLLVQLWVVLRSPIISNFRKSAAISSFTKLLDNITTDSASIVCEGLLQILQREQIRSNPQIQQEPTSSTVRTQTISTPETQPMDPFQIVLSTLQCPDLSLQQQICLIQSLVQLGIHYTHDPIFEICSLIKDSIATKVGIRTLLPELCALLALHCDSTEKAEQCCRLILNTLKQFGADAVQVGCFLLCAQIMDLCKDDRFSFKNLAEWLINLPPVDREAQPAYYAALHFTKQKGYLFQVATINTKCTNVLNSILLFPEETAATPITHVSGLLEELRTSPTNVNVRTIQSLFARMVPHFKILATADTTQKQLILPIKVPIDIFTLPSQFLHSIHDQDLQRAALSFETAMSVLINDGRTKLTNATNTDQQNHIIRWQNRIPPLTFISSLTRLALFFTHNIRAAAALETTLIAMDVATRLQNQQTSTNSTPQPTNNPPQPTNSTPQPANSTPQPTNSTPQPTNSTPQPANGQPQPANGQPQPANGQPQPANGQPQPANGPDLATLRQRQVEQQATVEYYQSSMCTSARTVLTEAEAWAQTTPSNTVGESYSNRLGRVMANMLNHRPDERARVSLHILRDVAEQVSEQLNQLEKQELPKLIKLSTQIENSTPFNTDDISQARSNKEKADIRSDIEKTEALINHYEKIIDYCRSVFDPRRNQ